TPLARNRKKKPGSERERSRPSTSLRSASGKLSARVSRGGEVLAEAAVWALLLLVWWYHDRGAKDAFRLPKLVLSQGLVLVSLFFLSFRLQVVPQVRAGILRRLPAVRAALPLVAVAGLSLLTTAYPYQGREAWISLLIGAAALVGWSIGFSEAARNRLLGGILLPAGALSVVGILQYHDVYRPFDFSGQVEAQRLGVTSFAGSAGDLAVMLVLPCLIAQHRLLTRRGLERLLWGVGLALCLYCLAVTQTLTCILALVAGSLLFWLWVLPWRRAVAVMALVAVVTGVLVVTVAPLRERVTIKARQLSRGSLNSVLTGRLDGWQAALWMFRQHPLLGVGQGAYRTEFADAKLALLEEGREFLGSQTQVMFVNAHNEPLEVLAETGVLGAAALLWGLWVLLRVTRRRMPRRSARKEGADGPDPPSGGSADSALAWSGLAALLLLSLGQFPFRLALTGYPAVLFLAWLLGGMEGEEDPS
ncbi:MAG: O-antigen ligase family protein, partial [Acidobacteria bacterium]|nr:O-antigen ligase family protein [Acidobacteriota bacterium]